MDINFTEILERVLKYLILGLAVAAACYFTKLKTDEIIIIAVTASVTFAILDMYTPKVSDEARLRIYS